MRGVTTTSGRISVRCGEAEQAVWRESVAKLDQCFQGRATFGLSAFTHLSAAAMENSDIICLSPLSDLARRANSWAELEAEWRNAAIALRDKAEARGLPVFVASIFRALPREDWALLPRLRRLNLMAARLSQEFGFSVIDLNRVLAHRGAIGIEGDGWLLNAGARSAAAETIVDTLLASGLGNIVDDEAVERALRYWTNRRTAAPDHAFPAEPRIPARAETGTPDGETADDRGGERAALPALRSGAIEALARRQKPWRWMTAWRGKR
jgi:hypothetical protein